MRRNGGVRDRFRRVAVLGAATALFLVGTGTGPACAETVRSLQWYLDGMQAEEMWKVSTGAGVTVAVIDTGVDDTLPDLRGQVLPGKDFLPSGDGSHKDTKGHGTAIGVLIAGTGKGPGGTGTMGLAPGARILPLRVMSTTDGWIQENAAIVKAIRYAADSPARIINMSLAAPVQSREMDEAITYALSKGKLVFAGSGNSAREGNPVLYPAASPGAVAVAAVDKNVRVTDESSRGPHVALAAPGADLVHSCVGGTGICRSHGTSGASALASASAALLWSVHPDWTANQVLRVLINTAGGAKSGAKRTDLIGYGVVRPRIALKEPGDPGPADVNPLTGAKGSGAVSEPVPRRSGGGGDSVKAAKASGGGRGMGSTTWVLVGAGGVVVAGGAGALLVARRRRRAAGSGSSAH
ncbi:type VII secretion-associated serine protease mycosin [Streptomyces huiliensis]|uniref:type VII secretion-associated serine protease mycosin n=1 Tax=Streptomyces huiliensis TaxID=2876027 RepID=UPI001CBE6B13|nr:type VII secretion-associated serine protease mycosin [Streptomyces huiliensis]